MPSYPRSSNEHVITTSWHNNSMQTSQIHYSQADLCRSPPSLMGGSLALLRNSALHVHVKYRAEQSSFLGLILNGTHWFSANKSSILCAQARTLTIAQVEVKLSVYIHVYILYMYLLMYTNHKTDIRGGNSTVYMLLFKYTTTCTRKQVSKHLPLQPVLIITFTFN